MAAIARPLALKAGVWFRRGRLVIVSPRFAGHNVPAVRQKLHLSSCADLALRSMLRKGGHEYEKGDPAGRGKGNSPSVRQRCHALWLHQGPRQLAAGRKRRARTVSSLVGTLNRITRTMKAAAVEAAHELGQVPVKHWAQAAERRPE